MSEEKIVGILQKVKSPCIRCSQDVVGFLIPDGRFICPNCDPAAVYERWVREWEPYRQALLKAKADKRAERVAAVKAEREKRMQAARERMAAEAAPKLAAQKEKRRREWWKLTSGLMAGLLEFLRVVLAAIAILGALSLCVVFFGPLLGLLVFVGVGVLFALIGITLRLERIAAASERRLSAVERHQHQASEKN